MECLGYNLKLWVGGEDVLLVFFVLGVGEVRCLHNTQVGCLCSFVFKGRHD